MSLPNLPMVLVNIILMDADELDERSNVRQVIYNKISKNHEFRSKFKQKYLQDFAKIAKLIKFKISNPPEITLILPATISTPPREQIRFCNREQTKEEREATVSRLKPAIIVKFPIRYTCYDENDDYFDYYKWSYCSFDNGYVFIEKKSCEVEDFDDYFFRFHRGSICLDGHIFPIFRMPSRPVEIYKQKGDQNPFDIDICTEIKYLEKELGMKVWQKDNYSLSYNFYDETTENLSSGTLTKQEAVFLVPHYDPYDGPDSEPEYDYYSD